MTSRITGGVRIIGAGLLGTSIGLALSKLGVDVAIEDLSPAVQSLSIDYGAGRRPAADDSPALVIACVPPDVTAEVVAKALRDFEHATVTDVASVKTAILSELQQAKVDLSRYVGSHPMAGRERGGAASARSDLFMGRVWVITPTSESTSQAQQQVEDLARDLGSAAVTLTAEEHDRAVAVVSHVPQILSSLTASMLVDAAEQDVNLAGQGIRDTTRIAASDAKLWLQILTANSQEVNSVLKRFQSELSKVIAALDKADAPGALSAINEALSRGNRGVERLPGKHGTKATKYSTVTVMIDDQPGELARLLTEIGEFGINLEEIKLEHSPSSAVGLVEVSVLPSVEGKLIADLINRNWKLVG